MTLNDYLVGIRWHDVIIVGAGHNGLVAALVLARKGLKVLVVEERDTVGGAARTERPFTRAPELAASAGAHLLGLMPPELLQSLEVELPLVRRDPSAFLAAEGAAERRGVSVTFGSDRALTRAQITRLSCATDARAHEAMEDELAAIRDDVAPSWLDEPRAIEDVAERFVRGPLRSAFVSLCRLPLKDYLDRWGFESEHLRAMYAASAGFAGTGDPFTTPGSGMSFLVDHMTRLAGPTDGPRGGATVAGSWMLVRGGMGTVSRAIADAAVRAGAIVETEAKVGHVVVDGNVVKGVVLKDGTMHHAATVLCNCDPFRMQALLPKGTLPAEYEARLEGYRRDGGMMKINLALSSLPSVPGLPEASMPTVHFLAGEWSSRGAAMRSTAAAYAAVAEGRLADVPSIQMVLDAAVTSRDSEGRTSGALFVQPVPYSLSPLAGTTWEAEEERYVKHVLALCERFAPKMSAHVVEAIALHPAKIEATFGMTRGHIHHVDNDFGFADRLPYATPIQGLYSCSAGTHPAGGVIGAAGHNAAKRVLADLGKGSQRPPRSFPPASGRGAGG